MGEELLIWRGCGNEFTPGFAFRVRKSGMVGLFRTPPGGGGWIGPGKEGLKPEGKPSGGTLMEPGMPEECWGGDNRELGGVVWF